MGWFAINILLPVFAPLALLSIAGRCCTPAEPFSSRASLLRTVKDGQLGWVAVVYSANATYELIVSVQAGLQSAWVGPAIAANILVLVISGMAAVLGALFPVPERNAPRQFDWSWISHFRLLCLSVVAALAASTSLCRVHFVLGTACNRAN